MVKSQSLKSMAKTVLKDNQYMSLGTSSGAGKAWVSPVVYAYDKNLNLYFMSLPSSKHCQNIELDPIVSVAIFDSHQNFGQGVGLQIRAKVNKVAVKDIPAVFKLYFGRKWPYGKLENINEFKRFFKMYKYKFYKCTPLETFLNDPRKEYDCRVKVRL